MPKFHKKNQLCTTVKQFYYCIAQNFQKVKFSKISVNMILKSIFENPPNNAR